MTNKPRETKTLKGLLNSEVKKIIIAECQYEYPNVEQSYVFMEDDLNRAAQKIGDLIRLTVKDVKQDLNPDAESIRREAVEGFAGYLDMQRFHVDEDYNRNAKIVLGVYKRTYLRGWRGKLEKPEVKAYLQQELDSSKKDET